MPRLLGVDIPNNRPTVISLTYLYGVGPHIAAELCRKAGVDPLARAKDLKEEEVAKLAALLDNDYTVEGQLRRQVNQNIQRLRDIGCYRGSATARGSRFAVSAPRRTPAPAKAPKRPSPGRRASRICVNRGV